ncbi:putative peroxisomal membrane protein [Clavispora lusitaniae]|uniref:Peroxisomal membrane protein n=1 Tax=Clavispora lusitaniae TaxID=36911 RepID=A0ACD0WIU7_CLALS|nr:putative peroxisomal membrane protein [Clavispora lusitaniae]QFZ33462.1 putative peroxisomal membrane protein [Clavispora lusitaniae]QFZ39133.1 putative peroxisomal membrane protein [Clavispora lusitaniae]QFZ44815.1 putative peroxisomal membrane protein [Clavispora lusitaniae]QFZ50492.1 putative peroxisomal membrane protein [Clavispora lusitaniae]
MDEYDVQEPSEPLRAEFAPDSEAKVQPQTSPLLSSTPPAVAKALVKAYPYLLIVNKTLQVATWTNDNTWLNVAAMGVYALVVLHFETLVTWSGHFLLVLVLVSYAVLNQRISDEAARRPTLDDVVHALTTTCVHADMVLSPVTSMALTSYDIKRLIFTTVFLTPVYLAVTVFLVAPRTIVLVVGLYAISYHSAHMRIARRLLWSLRFTRVLFFYLTGLDLSRARNSTLFAAAFAKVQKATGPVSDLAKPVRFTYVIYENQRRWIGIGWTANLLTYERAPWTDEFLNESSSIDSFELPNADSSFSSQHQQYVSQHPEITGARWRWVDKTWRLDLTNDGAIALPSGKRSKTTANPNSDEGFIYYDNVWKKPSTEDSYSKYTRRRRWIRTAELVFESDAKPDTPRRKSLRFADPESDDSDLDTKKNE